MTLIAGVIGENMEENFLLLKDSLDKGRRRYTKDTACIHCENGSFGLGFTHNHENADNIGVFRDIVVVIDGFIFNKEKLCYLIQNSVHISTVRLVAELYLKYNSDLFSRLIGEFSIAIWDSKNRKLLLAVDHLGLRPMFFKIKYNRVHFGSTIIQMKDSNDKVNVLQVKRILSSLNTGPLHTQSTTFHNIYRVPPGNYVIVEDNKYNVYRYWDIDTISPTRFSSRYEYADKLKELLIEASSHYASISKGNSSVTIAFSGGIDSTALLFLLLMNRDVTKVDPSALVVKFSKLTGDEEYQQILDSLNVKSEILQASNRLYDFQDKWYELPTMDEPSIQMLCGSRMLHAQAEAVKKLGASYVFFGTGGDELWEGSHSWIADYIRSKQWIHAFKGIKDWSRAPNNTLYNMMNSKVRDAFKPQFPGYWLKPSVPYILNNKEFYGENWEELTSEFKDLDYANNHNRRDLYSRLLLSTDCVSRNDYGFLGYGIQEAMPFYYKPLIEFAMSIPQELNYEIDSTGEWISKKLLREALEGIVPPFHLARRTKGMAGDTLVTGFRKARDFLGELFLDGNCILTQLNLLDSKYMEYIIERWVIGIDTNDAYTIISTEMWLRQNYT